MDNKDYLATILPHKKPMILIDDIIDYSIEDKWLKSIVTIRPDSLFFDKTLNGISSIIGIEYMAQTIGCYAFLRKKQATPKIGFLLGTRLYNNLLDKFDVDNTYIIKINEVFFDNDIASFDCYIFDSDNNEVASATVNAYQSDNIEREFING